MPTIGYAAMYAQFAPSDLLHYCQAAEKVGFTSVMASGYLHSWTPNERTASQMSETGILSAMITSGASPLMSPARCMIPTIPHRRDDPGMRRAL